MAYLEDAVAAHEQLILTTSPQASAGVLLRRWQPGRSAATVGLDRVSDCSCEFVERSCGAEPG
jgi:hypothetical protein